MSWKQKATSGGGDFPVPEAGSRIAVLVGLIDLGTHDESYDNTPKEVHKVMLVWELVDEPDRPLIGKDYNFSFNEKAKLRQHIESWRGKKLNENEEFDLSVLLGKACSLQLVHKKTAKDRTFAVIDGIGQLHKSLKADPPKQKPFSWEIETSDGKDVPTSAVWPRVYGVPVEEVIRNSHEWLEKYGVASPRTREPATAGAVANGTADPSEAADYF